jgi:hypothetical protein
VHAVGGRLVVRECEVAAGGIGVGVNGGCQAQLEGGAVQGCEWGLYVSGAGTHLAAANVTIQNCTENGVYAANNATVALCGCTLRENGQDCWEEYEGSLCDGGYGMDFE